MIDTTIIIRNNDKDINRTVVLPYVLDPSTKMCYDNRDHEYRFCIGSLDTQLDITEPLYQIANLVHGNQDVFDEVRINSAGYFIKVKEACITVTRNAYGLFIEIASDIRNVYQK